MLHPILFSANHPYKLSAMLNKDNINPRYIIKATEADIDAVVEIYNIIHQLEEEGKLSIGWDREIYPIKITAENALIDGSLFVMKIGDEVVGSAIINQLQPAGYSTVDWNFPAQNNKVGVLHTLVVHPTFTNMGLGKEFVSFFEEYCRRLGYEVVRLDTQTKNIGPFNLYPRLGYTLAAIKEVPFQNLPTNVNLAMFEKKL